MIIESIPVEILVVILKNVEAKDLIACRAVCRRWRDVVDSLSDEVWEDYCYRDFWNPKAANKVSNLGFCELYKSLTLWSKVEKAEITCKQLPGKVVDNFKILNNNTLVVLMNDRHNYGWGPLQRLYSNQVEYYDMENMTLIAHEQYNFYFHKYDENDKLITLVNAAGDLCVITKSNKKRFLVGKMHSVSNYTLFETEVYFVNTKDFICVARLKVVDGEETIESKELEEIAEHIIAFSCASEKSVNMLTDEGNIYRYQHHDNDFETCSQIDGWTPDIIYELWEFGFHWSNPKIYSWLSFFEEEQVNITKLQSAVIHSHNHVVLIGTSRGVVHIYKRPYCKGELILYKARPNRSIQMNKYSCADAKDVPCEARESKNIKQLGIVEILNGHRIIVLTKNKLFFVDLVLKQHKVNKRGATSLTSAEPSTSSKKKAKIVKKRPIQSKVVNNITAKRSGTPQMATETNEKAQKKNKAGKKNKKISNTPVKHVYNTRSKGPLLTSNK